MKVWNTTEVSGIWMVIAIVFGVTQVQHYYLSEQVKASKTIPGTQQAPTTSPERNGVSSSAFEPEETFIADGKSIVRRSAGGAAEVVIPDYSTLMDEGISGEVKIIAHTGVGTAVVAPMCWEGNAMRRLYRLSADDKTLTAMESQAPCTLYVEPEERGRFSEYLIYPGPNGDRFVKVDFTEDRSSEVGVLPKPYTYVMTMDESGYSAFITGEVRWGYGGFETDVFDGSVPLGLFDRRLPIMVKKIHE